MPGLPQQRQFNPYSENGGTILAIAGADFSVIAGDTRQSEGYSIQTRYAPKVFRLSVLFPDVPVGLKSIDLCADLCQD
jgi:20S proteasome subunit beta 6